MKFNRSTYLAMASAAVALASLAGTGAAQAHDVSWSVGIGVPGVVVGASNGYYQPAPVYIQPQPYYVPPPRVVYREPVYIAPSPVYYQPEPTYYAPPAYGYYGSYYRGGHYGHGYGHDRGRGHWDRD